MRTKLTYLGMVLAAALMAVLCLTVPGQANALTLLTPRSGPVLGTGNGYYTSPVNLCTRLGAESVGYVEQNSATKANCAAGYAQIVTNTPYLANPFTLTLGSAVYSCSPIEVAGGEPVVSAVSCTPKASP